MASTVATKRAHRPRTVAPKATTPAEVPATKPSIWTRVKTAAKKTAAVVAKPFKAVATKTAPVAKKIGTGIAKPFKKVAKAITSAAKTAKTRTVRTYRAVTTKVAPRLERVWHWALVPFLRGWFKALALIGLTAALIANPMVAIASLVVAGTTCLLLSMGLVALEDAESTMPWARMTLTILDGIARVIIGAVYAVAAFDAVVLSIVIPPVAVFNIIALVRLYRANARAPHEAAIDVTPVAAVREDIAPRGNFLHAKGTEELWGTEHDQPLEADVVDPNWAEVWVNDQVCVACGTDAGATRVATDGPAATHGLCSVCFDLQCEEDALKFTGVSLKARSVEVRLNQTGIAHAKEYAASKFDSTSYHWMESAWWRDRNGTEYAREKVCLMDGREVARVVHDYKRKVYRASVLGQLVRNGVKTTWELAQHAAQDELNDERAAVHRHEVAAAEVVGVTALRLQAQKA